MQSQDHVIIVGAGAAGIGAGLELAAQGIPFTILEAADRVGGRAFTDTQSLGTAWDHGCHWLHCADENPLVAWADKLGSQYQTFTHAERHNTYWSDGGFMPEAALGEAEVAFAAEFGAIYEAGTAGKDVPLTDILDRQNRWHPNIYCLLGLLAGDDPERVSSLGYCDYADTEADWPVYSGYGDLIEMMSRDLPIRLGVSVNAINQGADGVRIETSDGTIDAKGVIVTPSTNVLNSGAISFGPGPAADLLPLIADVPCGVYEKVAFRLSRLPNELEGKRFGMITPEGGAAMNMQIISGDAPMIIVHLAGDMVRDLLAQGPDGLSRFATERLALAFGETIHDLIEGIAVTGWTNNPLIQGSYSHATPGTGAQRHEMIATDTGNVAFAGEAFSLRWQATAHGAYQSGREVAKRLTKHL